MVRLHAFMNVQKPISVFRMVGFVSNLPRSRLRYIMIVVIGNTLRSYFWFNIKDILFYICLFTREVISKKVILMARLIIYMTDHN